VAYIYNPKTTLEIRRRLRKDEPVTERLLWSKLRNRQLLGFKFRRQYGIGIYSVDFCCPDQRLVVEIDGDSHYLDANVIAKDKERQNYIEELNFKVLRFTNKEIMENIEGVLLTITRALKLGESLK
jgi:very-short-patch-repair endonuclease